MRKSRSRLAGRTEATCVSIGAKLVRKPTRRGVPALKRAKDINGANHLGNDSMVSMISEARARFLFDVGIEDMKDVHTSIIVTDLASTYRAEAYARDQLCFEVGIMDFNKYGGDIIFRITRPADGTLIAMAKSGFVFFNYDTKKVVPMPKAFSGKFPNVNAVD